MSALDDQLLEAVSYVRSELNEFLKVEPFEGMLEDAIALLAYDDPLKSCVGYLLKQSQREFAADVVNTVVLSTNPNLKNTELHVLMPGEVAEASICLHFGMEGIE